MPETFIKYTIISLCSIYSFLRLMGIRLRNFSGRNIAFSIVFSLINGTVCALINGYARPSIIPIQIISITIFLYVLCKEELTLTINASIIAYTYTNIVTIISTVATGAVLAPFHLSENTFDLLLAAVFGVLDILIVPLIFLIPRFKGGMPFLRTKFNGNAGLLFCSIILISMLIIGNHDADLAIILALCAAVIFAVLFYIWWKERLSKYYIDRLTDRKITGLQEQLDSLQYEYDTLSTENMSMATIIHRDNKLVPTIHTAVEQCCDRCMSIDDIQEIKNRLTELKKYTGQMYADRYGVVASFDTESATLESTGLFSIDALVKHMYFKARSRNIQLKTTAQYDISILIQKYISENDLRTIIADLLENAIIAVSDSDNDTKLVHMELTQTNNIYSIVFHDSGIPFSKNVLSQIGKKRITTHADQGGSGIGLYNTCCLLRECSASLRISSGTAQNCFTKSVAVIFDGKNKITV